MSGQLPDKRERIILFISDGKARLPRFMGWTAGGKPGKGN